MANSSLIATSPLESYDQRFGETSLTEANQLSIYSIGLGLQTDAALASIDKSLGTAWPTVGHSSVNAEKTYRLLGMQPDQVFALTTANAKLPVLDESAYITEQSDSWACLWLHGPMSRAALERICPIDLHPSVFPEGNVTRTIMEHLAVIVLHEDNNRFLLLSPTSSAQSFLHAVETSLRNVHT